MIININNLEKTLNILKNILQQSDKIILEYYNKLDEKDVIFKGDIDLVTKADIETENFLIKEIKKNFENIKFISEETNNDYKNIDNSVYFIIDPIDGTTNFAHKIPFFATSIAIMINKEIVLSLISIPIFKEIYHAIKGKGAFLNNKKISVSSRDKLINSVIATGFAGITKRQPKNTLKIFNELSYKCRSIRRIGSAVCNLCYVACGKFDGHYEYYLSIWDIASGILLVKEAGGIVSDFNKNYDILLKKEIVASNTKIYNELISIIKNNF